MWGCCVLLTSVHVFSQNLLSSIIANPALWYHSYTSKPPQNCFPATSNFHFVLCVNKSQFNFCSAQNDTSQNKFGQCHFITVNEDRDSSEKSQNLHPTMHLQGQRRSQSPGECRNTPWAGHQSLTRFPVRLVTFLDSGRKVWTSVWLPNCPSLWGCDTLS